MPVLSSTGLWGLLVAHHCQSPFDWSKDHIEAMQVGALTLAQASIIRDGFQKIRS